MNGPAGRFSETDWPPALSDSCTGAGVWLTAKVKAPPSVTPGIRPARLTVPDSCPASPLGWPPTAGRITSRPCPPVSTGVAIELKLIDTPVAAIATCVWPVELVLCCTAKAPLRVTAPAMVSVAVPEIAKYGPAGTVVVSGRTCGWLVVLMASVIVPFRVAGPSTRLPLVPRLRSPAIPPWVMSSEPVLMLIGGSDPRVIEALLTATVTVATPAVTDRVKAKVPLMAWPRKPSEAVPETAR